MKKQSGVVSLPTTVLVSVLLMLILTSLMTLMVGELRQATDADTSVRAFFGAESGLELGELLVRQEIASGAPIDQACVQLSIGNSTITCQKITFTSSSLSQTLNNNDAYELIIPPGYAFDTIQLSWNLHKNPSDPNNPSASVPLKDENGNPLGNNVTPNFDTNAGPRQWTYPAVLEVTTLDFAPNITTGSSCSGGSGIDGGASTSTLCRQQWVLVPKNTPGLAGTTTLLPGTTAKQSISCRANHFINSAYDCGTNIQLGGTPAGHSRIIRIVPRYRQQTPINLQFYSGGSLVPVPSGGVEVDVTAKAGDTYRRVVADIPMENNQLGSGLDYVLFSNRSISQSCSVSVILGISGCD
jgi:hypothetical protein